MASDDQVSLLLLEKNESKGDSYSTGDGSVDYHGNPVLKHKTGNWKACTFILGNELCERLAYFAISTNIVTYLTKKLHEGNVSAARNVSTWQGTCYFTPFIGALLADAYWGRYWTIAVFSTIYFIGMCTLTLSASVPALKPPECIGSVCPKASVAQHAVFFVGLYTIALGTGGIKPCVAFFGADQFDDSDQAERVNKASFFNWFFFAINIGALMSGTLLVWVQDNCGWALGFGIPTLIMGLAIGSFFIGTTLYRFQRPGGSPLTRICRVAVASVRNWSVDVPAGDSSLLYENSESEIKGSPNLEHSSEFKLLDKAAIVTDLEKVSKPWKVCTVTPVEEVKILIRMLPIFTTGIVFSAIYAQMYTMFVEQGMTLNTKLGAFTIPPASLATLETISVLMCIPLYDQVLVPITKRFTGRDRGISVLQRIGIGYFISILVMAVAALVEARRLKEKTAIPMRFFWQIPQYFLVGVAEVFTFIGQMEFFYDQSPDAMRSLCSALSLLMTALGNYLASLILTVVTYFTTRGEKPGWIPDDLNEGHLDYFFWLLAGLSFVNLLVFFYCSSRYKYKKSS